MNISIKACLKIETNQSTGRIKKLNMSRLKRYRLKRGTAYPFINVAAGNYTTVIDRLSCQIIYSDGCNTNLHPSKKWLPFKIFSSADFMEDRQRDIWCITEE